ncbi:SANT/Myb_domain [Hexamita inflata]|uniref:SANT/Myb domain n=1 Tax=Hexamita inflata TaxID=28002 RepID=A0AA86Q8X9_9EUKA|nr:SANT/Myb domain [Hexamita inflata]
MSRTNRWTQEEQELFDRLIIEYQKDFKKISAAFGNRSYNQIRSHYYNSVYKDQQISNSSMSETAVTPQTDYRYDEVSFNYDLFALGKLNLFGDVMVINM